MDYQKIADELESEYVSKIETLANDVFNKKIKPYLLKHNIGFLSGNGTYIFYKNNPNNRAYGYDDVTDEMPQDILNLVQITLPFRGNEELGLWMDSFFNPKFGEK